ncbi:MAG: ATP-binding protein, partial [Acidobacteriia bacterium]|nr:ATP-binding protein [Methyloceanibacter sp.]MCL6492891.1 ATP-binding protein [Terriglobia bacterium]
RERFAPYDLIQEGAAQIALLAPLCTVSNAVPKDLFVSADRLQLSRVFGNLLRNAAEAGAKSIVVSARRLAHATEFAVRDNGPGLPETVRARCFSPLPRRGAAAPGLGLLLHAN